MNVISQPAPTLGKTAGLRQMGALFGRVAIAKRLYLGFGAILVILAVVTVLAMVKVQVIDAALQANGERHVVIQRYAINFRGSAHDRSIAIRDVVLSADASAREQEVAAIRALAAFYADSAKPLEAFLASGEAPPELGKLYQDIQAIEAQTVATTNAIIAMAQKGESPAAMHDLLWSQAKPQYEQWLAAINRLIDFKEAKIQVENATAQQQAGSFLRLMLTALILALLSGGTLAWFISRGILTQLGAEPRHLGGVARRVAHGDLQPVWGIDRAPGGSVLASLGMMQTSLAHMVGQVRQTSDSIAAGSTQIATGNADLSLRTEEQADHLRQTATLMEQMTATVQNTADAARQATQFAVSASEAAAKGGTLVGQVVSTMDDIRTESRKIADIIGVIDSIAFQTNILALNAAVEATRAGEQGRGFAVVAGEVRNLARRSAEAANEIKALINASAAKIGAGSQLVGAAGTTMTDIVAQAQRVADLIAEISGSTTEQTQGIAQVNAAISHLDQSTQHNAALGEESAAAAASLQQQAKDLAELVSAFKL